jgi:hypothetical protein
MMAMSGERDFAKHMRDICSHYVGDRVHVDAVDRLLIVHPRTGPAKVHINDFPIRAQVLSKRSVQAGEAVLLRDIAGIRTIDFPGVVITEEDRVIYATRHHWSFALYFDAGRGLKVGENPLDVAQFYRALGGVHTSLLFREELQTIGSESRLKRLATNGWFPFVELFGGDFEALARVYATKRGAAKRLAVWMSRFPADRIQKIVSRWWGTPEMVAKRAVLNAGVDAYLSGTADRPSVYINCIKNLSSEIEGLLRVKYHGGRRRPKYSDLLAAFENDLKSRAGLVASLFFPEQLIGYLKSSFLSDFDVAAGVIPFSRHSVLHGVVDRSEYTQERALQLILLLDHIRFGLEVT